MVQTAEAFSAARSARAWAGVDAATRAVRAVQAAACAFALLVLADVLVHAAHVQAKLAAAWLLVPIAAGAAVLVCAGALVAELRAPAPHPAAGAALRGAATLAVAVWAAFVAFAHPFRELPLELAVLALAASWSLLVVLLRRGAPLPRSLARSEGLAFRAALVLAATELLLRAVAAAWPTQVLAGASSSPLAVLEANRPPAGALRYGFPYDERGHYDRRPPPPPRPGLLVVSIGDSFSHGVVPRPAHYSSVCERVLGTLIHDGAPAVEVYNMGLPSIDPPEYLELLVREALPLAPDLVVVQLFAGNDLTSVRLSPPGPLESWFARENVVLWRVVERAAKLVAERRARAPRGAGPAAPADAQRIELELPHLRDPTLEPPGCSQPTFARIEGERAVGIAAPSEDFAELLPWIERMVAAAGETPIAFTLIPDEFQVEDGVWELALEYLREEGVEVEVLQRDRPQQVLATWFERRGVPLLDLLPVLRAVEPLPDGDRHLYHLRDTHWNARGNAVAGEALARFVHALLGERAARADRPGPASR